MAKISRDEAPTRAVRSGTRAQTIVIADSAKKRQKTNELLSPPTNIDGVPFAAAARKRDLPRINLMDKFNAAAKSPKKPAAGRNVEKDDDATSASSFAQAIDGAKKIVLDTAKKAAKAAEIAAKTLQKKSNR